MSDPTPCIVRHDHGQTYHPGHNTHWTHAASARPPWGWRDAVVSGIDGHRVSVTYVDGGRQVQLWHHDELSGELDLGAPVRLHEQYYVLGSPSAG